MRLMNDHLDSGKCATASTAGCDARTDARNDDGDDARASARRVSTNATDAWTALMRRGANDDANDDRRSRDAERHENGPSRSFGSGRRLPGHFVVENFVTAAEETALVAFLDDARRSGAWKPSTFNGKHLGKKWGVEVDLKRRTVARGRRPMPPELLALAARLRAFAARTLEGNASASAPNDDAKTSGATRGGAEPDGCVLPRAAARAVATFAPNEANAIDYRRALGMELEPHCDDRQMSSGVLVNLSLLGDCVMTYAPDARSRRNACVAATDAFLPRRSLQIQSGSTRYDFSHAIRNENLLTDRRVSVTFRESAAPATRTKVRGG